MRHICDGFPGAYWRELETNEEYPDAFVKALTEAGYLGALIPERYGGAGLPLRAACVILEEIHATGCNAAACHAQMYIMGTLLRHGSEAQKQRYLPKIATGEIAPAGLRRHRAHDRHPTRRSSRRARSAAAIITSSTARRSGPRARCNPI